MEETYTFSRALYLMRYSGKKMKPIGKDVKKEYSYSVQDNILFFEFDRGVAHVSYSIDADEIMGSWVEVK